MFASPLPCPQAAPAEVFPDTLLAETFLWVGRLSKKLSPVFPSGKHPGPYEEILFQNPLASLDLLEKNIPPVLSQGSLQGLWADSGAP